MENKISKKQIILLIFLLIILILLVVVNIYVVFFRNTSATKSQDQNENSASSKNISKNVTLENEIDNNTTGNFIDTSDTNSVVVNLTDDVQTDELKELMENYCVGIQRISFDEENLESNTILLFIAKKYFDSNSNKSSLDIDTKYAASVENIHKYLTELTGHDYTNTDHIQSYSNYIGYASNSNSYIFGKDYNTISREKYECSDVTITKESDDGTYTAKANVTRTIDKEVTNYEITFDFTVNKSYTYEKYCIKSLKVKNTSFYPDNTLHFIDTSTVEEDENN